MDYRDRARLRINHTQLVDELDFSLIASQVISNGLINADEYDNILASENGTRRAQNTRFLLDLPRKGENAYKLFHDCLDKSGFKHLRVVLDRTDVSTITDDNWFEQYPAEVQDYVVTEKQLALLSKEIGLGWESIGLILGLSSVELDHCKMSHPYSPSMQILAMFTKWKGKNGSGATMAALAAALSGHAVYDCCFRQLLNDLRYSQESTCN